MLGLFFRLFFVTIFTFVFSFAGFANPKISYSVVDALKIQTIVYQTELYREYQIVIEDAVTREEQRIVKEAKNWDTEQWYSFVDALVDEKIILAIDENQVPGERVSLMKKIKQKVGGGLKSVISEIISMGRADGIGAVIAYLSASAISYSMVGVGVVIGSAGMVSLFSLFPFETVTLTAAMTIKGIVDKIKVKKAFNEDEDFNYYSEYKQITKKVKKHLNITKGDLIYAFNDQNGVVIRKKGILPGLLSFIGLSKNKLSLRYLVKTLKNEGLFTNEIKKIKKNKKLDSIEKIVAMIKYIDKNFEQSEKDKVLDHFTRQRVYDLPMVQNMKRIAIWAMEAKEIQDLSELPAVLNKAPKGTALVTVIKIYQDYIFPELANKIRGIQFRKFKCLKKGFFKQTAFAHKSLRLLWLSDSKEVTQIYSGIEACL